jgi:hypothetical protein
VTLPCASWHDTCRATVCRLPYSLVFGQDCLYTSVYTHTRVWPYLGIDTGIYSCIPRYQGPSTRDRSTAVVLLYILQYMCISTRGTKFSIRVLCSWRITKQLSIGINYLYVSICPLWQNIHVCYKTSLKKVPYHRRRLTQIWGETVIQIYKIVCGKLA